MAALASTDVTVTVAARDRHLLGQGIKMTIATVTFGTGALTYPTGGVPLPDKSTFGMSKGIKALLLQESTAGYVYRYDPVNHKLMMFYADNDAGADSVLIEIANSVAPAAATLKFVVFGS